MPWQKIIHSKYFTYGVYFFSSFLLIQVILDGDWDYFIAHDEVNPYFKPARVFAQNLNNPSYFWELLTHSSHNFGHPPLFPLLAGIFMYFFGISVYMAKTFICMTSAISVFLLFLLGDHVFKDKILNLCFVLSILASSLYTSLFSLFLGDVFLLPFCILFLLNYLKKQYIFMAITGVLGAYTRESFLFFSGGIFAYELYKYLFQKDLNIKAITSSLIAILSSLSFFITNKIIYGKFVHHFASIDIKDAKVTGLLNNYVSIQKNIIHFFGLLAPHDKKIFFLIFLLFMLLIFYKKLSPLLKKCTFITIFINLCAFVPLSFFEGFFPRYMIYGFCLLYLIYFVFLKDFILNKKVLYTVSLVSVLVFSVIPEKEYQIFYSKNAHIDYQKLKKLLDPFMEFEYSEEPIFICFPYNLLACDYDDIYGGKMYDNLNCKVEIDKEIDKDVYLICDKYTFKYLLVKRKNFFKQRESILINKFLLGPNKLNIQIKKYFAPTSVN